MELLEKIAFNSIDAVLPLLQNNIIVRKYQKSRGVEFDDITDGAHTFNDLYHERMKLTSKLFNLFPEYAWKTFSHSDGSIWDGYFIVGVSIPEVGDYTYHYQTEFWDEFKVQVIDKAPEYDGHTTLDVDRLDKLIDLRFKKNK